MKTLTMLTMLLTVVSCSTAQTKPTPFKTTSKNVLIVVPGCEALHKDVEEWNIANPDKKPREADC